jgi:hypothetical protein
MREFSAIFTRRKGFLLSQWVVNNKRLRKTGVFTCMTIDNKNAVLRSVNLTMIINPLKMQTIHIAKYQPYDHIRLSHEVVLNSLRTDLSRYDARRTIIKKDAIKQPAIVKISNSTVAAFGELEWMMLKMV